MIIDEIREKIKKTEPDLNIIKQYWRNSQLDDQLQRLNSISQKESFWRNSDQATIMQELQKLKKIHEEYTSLIENYEDLAELTELFASDENELQKVATEVQTWANRVRKFKVNMLLPDDQDSSNCFLSINAGAGGTESQDWAGMLLRMYIRFCEHERLHATIADYQAGEAAGIKSATLYIKGTNAYGLLKSEQGIHRLIRISPFDSSKRRHTSFAATMVSPEVPKVQITIHPDDLRIDTYRASGAGGQHVNKTESAVRITHMPSGIVVQCQNERSQIKNRETAMKMLMARLVQKQKQEDQAKKASIEKKKIEWGSQIRSYVLHPYKMVKDHRTGKESSQPELILDGELMDFIEAYLVYKQHEQTIHS